MYDHGNEGLYAVLVRVFRWTQSAIKIQVVNRTTTVWSNIIGATATAAMILIVLLILLLLYSCLRLVCGPVSLISPTCYMLETFSAGNVQVRNGMYTHTMYTHTHTNTHTIVVPLDGGVVATTILSILQIISYFEVSYLLSSSIKKKGTDQRCTTAMRKANFFGCNRADCWSLERCAAWNRIQWEWYWL